MTHVDRRPTVARNFLAGDRRSVEWAMEQWLSLRPPVDQVSLSGDGVSVTATALGLRDLGILRGLRGAPFSVEAVLPAGPATTSLALAEATGASVITGKELGRGDVLLMVDAHELDRATRHDVEAASDAAEHGAVAVVGPHDSVPRAWRGKRCARIAVVPTTVASLGLCPLWEAAMEDRGVRRIVVCGSGARLFGAVVAAGDFFLERTRTLPSPTESRQLLLERVAILREGTRPPPGCNSVDDVWRAVCRAAGATVVSASATTAPGVVIVPSRSQRRAA
ncbi:MAG: hypothetical protein AB2A00_18985 [Myxococcota bacterium]